MEATAQGLEQLGSTRGTTQLTAEDAPCRQTHPKFAQVGYSEEIMFSIVTLFIVLTLAIAPTAEAQPEQFELSRPEGLSINIDRFSGEPRLQVRYGLVYSDGDSSFTRRMGATYNEVTALVAGFSEQDIAMVVALLERVEDLTYTRKGMPPPPLPPPIAISKA